MPEKKRKSLNYIVIYTLLALVIVSVFLTANNYFSQLKIFQDKELEKLERVAKSLSSKVSGDDHEDLFNNFQTQKSATEVSQDSTYRYYSEMFEMAKSMNEINSEIYTMVYDSVANNFIFGISSSSSSIWRNRYLNYPKKILDEYHVGGRIEEPYEDENGYWLSAFQPIKNKNGQTVGILQVDEKFDLFLQRAKSQVYMNIWLSLVFILILATLMYINLRYILKKQNKLDEERREIELLRKDLIANVSHDLRTPLASIHGYLETIQMKMDSLPKEKLDRYINTSLKNTERLKKLIDELFEISIMESKEKKIHREPFQMNELILDVSTNFKIAAQRKGITIKTDLIKEAVLVSGDVQMIDRVLQNLLSNSIKYCDQNDEIILKTFSKNSKQLSVQVMDSGEGISQENLEGIFNRFTMGTSGKTGTGLGLAIVKNILELHDSSYEIKSEPKQGTVFTFELEICQQ